MQNLIVQDKNLIIRILLTDLVSITLIYLIPAISHLSPFPLYYAEPMRLVAIAAYFVSRNKWNAYIIALTLPVFSLIFSGHPTLFKASLISVELFLNIWLLDWILTKVKWSSFLALGISIVISKACYYAVKYVFISISLLEGKLISIPLQVQLMATILMSSIFYLFLKLGDKK